MQLDVVPPDPLIRLIAHGYEEHLRGVILNQQLEKDVSAIGTARDPAAIRTAMVGRALTA